MHVAIDGILVLMKYYTSAYIPRLFVPPHPLLEMLFLWLLYLMFISFKTLREEITSIFSSWLLFFQHIAQYLVGHRVIFN